MKVTVWPGNGVRAVVRTPESVAEDPLVAVVAPVYVRVVASSG